MTKERESSSGFPDFPVRYSRSNHCIPSYFSLYREIMWVTSYIYCWTKRFERFFFSFDKSSDADVRNFSKAHLFQGATDDQVNLVLGNYSQDPAAVSTSTHLPGTTP